MTGRIPSRCKDITFDFAHRVLRLGNGRLLAHLAPFLSQTRGLAAYPGWTFGACDQGGHLRHRLRIACWKIAKELSPPVGIVVPWYDGLRARLFLGNDLSWCLFVGGTFEPNEFHFLSKVLRPGMNVIDVGANDGLYALFAARRIGEGGRVLALEPSSREHDRLLANLRLNGIGNVTPLAVAAHEREGSACLHVGEFGHEGHNTLGRFAYPIEEVAQETVRLVPLDRLVEAQGLDHVEVIKIDAEGAEPAILRGARRTIERCRPLLLIEIVDAALRGQGYHREELLQLLESFGFRLWAFGPSGLPEPLRSREIDGCNLIAVHPSREEWLRPALSASAGRRDCAQDDQRTTNGIE